MKVKNLTDLSLELCKREGKKRQVNVFQMREIVRCLRDILREDPWNVLRILLKK